jgi:hypothetical protein
MWKTLAVDISDDIISIDGNVCTFDVLHVIVTEKFPPDEDLKYFYEELSTDIELGLTDLVPLKDYLLVRTEILDEEEINKWKQILGEYKENE